MLTGHPNGLPALSIRLACQFVLSNSFSAPKKPTAIINNGGLSMVKGVSNYTLTDISNAFRIIKLEVLTLIVSQGVIGSVITLTTWKTKYATTQTPLLPQITERNVVSPGEKPSGMIFVCFTEL